MQNERDYLELQLRELWPDPAVISSPCRFSRRGDVHDFVIVPHRNTPKLLLPLRPRRVAASAVRNFRTSAAGRRRFLFQGIAMAAHAGLGTLLPSRVRISWPDGRIGDGIDSHLSCVLNRPLFVSMYIGPSRAIQKPVLQLLTPEGSTFAFAKIGTNGLTRKLVNTEAENLKLLHSASLHSLRVPQIIHHGSWNGHEILVQEALATAVPKFSSAQHLGAAMEELANVSGAESLNLRSSPYWRRLDERITKLPDSDFSKTLRATLIRLESIASETILGFGSWHGDWVPWNMTQTRDHALVWDWEQFEKPVPIGFDAIHYRVQTAVATGTEDQVSAFDSARSECRELLAPFGVSTSVGPLVVVLYAMEIATRYIRDGEVEHRTPMSMLEVWLDPVLTRHLEYLGA